MKFKSGFFYTALATAVLANTTTYAQTSPCDQAKAPKSPITQTFTANLKGFFPANSCFEIVQENPAIEGFQYLVVDAKWTENGQVNEQRIDEITDGNIMISQALDLRTREDVVGTVKAKYAPPLKITTSSDDYVAGELGAPNTVIVYSDFACRYCRSAFEHLLAKAGKDVVFYKKHYSIAPNSAVLAKVVLAAKKSGMKDTVALQKSLYDLKVVNESPAKAQQAALEAIKNFGERKKVAEYLAANDAQLQMYVDQTIAFAKHQGWQGTPVVVINGKVIPGGFNRQAIDSALPSR
ncbi:DsbA family protein [Chrysiogenes arsenatis]|uniref:DsbA family protein n=1 Tax=Chrysiogenes arsenatis TaxID=309797 RepID=UPI00040FC72A|nr:thioredoxin domain-containing protein [Chrysiogenes arsenatis]